MAELETNLLNALQNAESASADKPCGCHEKASASDLTDAFGPGQMGEGADLEAQLDAALGAALSGSESSDFAAFDTLSLDEEMAFAQMSEGANLSLEDILALTEKYPGLKITFSY